MKIMLELTEKGLPIVTNEEIKCAIAGCTNTSYKGSFCGNVCLPCALSLTGHKCKHSQFHRNTNK